jgi:hypothetical protein
MDFKERGYEGVDWIQLAHNMVQEQAGDDVNLGFYIVESKGVGGS